MEQENLSSRYRRPVENGEVDLKGTKIPIVQLEVPQRSSAADHSLVVFLLRPKTRCPIELRFCSSCRRSCTSGNQPRAPSPWQYHRLFYRNPASRRRSRSPRSSNKRTLQVLGTHRVMIRAESVILAISGHSSGSSSARGWTSRSSSSPKRQGITDVVVPIPGLALFLVLAALLGLVAASWPARRGRQA